MMAEHPVLAVVDRGDAEQVVVWHVQTDPQAPSRLSGAWILDEAAVAAAGLLDGVVAVDVNSTMLATIATAIAADVQILKEEAAAAKQQNPQLKAPRFTVPQPPDVEAVAQAFHGEPIARRAWATATAAAELVADWHAVESTRRSRKYLAERFGTQVRALPVPQ